MQTDTQCIYRIWGDILVLFSEVTDIFFRDACPELKLFVSELLFLFKPLHMRIEGSPECWRKGS